MIWFKRRVTTILDCKRHTDIKFSPTLTSLMILTPIRNNAYIIDSSAF